MLITGPPFVTQHTGKGQCLLLAALIHHTANLDGKLCGLCHLKSLHSSPSQPITGIHLSPGAQPTHTNSLIQTSICAVHGHP